MIVAARRLLAGAALAAGALAPTPLAASAPPPVDRIAFAPAAGASLPLDAHFADEHGRALDLGQLLDSRPAIVVPAYYGCANLCGVVLHGVAAALAASGLRAGRDVDVIAVSIEPADRPEDAIAKERSIVGDAAEGWHFLTGDRPDIARFTRALGYRYVDVAAEREFAHAAGIAVVAPGGRVARVLGGVAYAPADLREAIESARGATKGTASADPDGSWLLCFHYDPRTGRYSVAAMTAVRAAALAALLALGAFFARAWRRERRGPKEPSR